jgi:hypothetical protein
MKRISSIFAWVGTAVLALGVGVGIVVATNRVAPATTTVRSTQSSTTTAPHVSHVAPTTTAPAPVYVAPPVTPVTQAPRVAPPTTSTRPPATTTTTTVTYSDGGDGQTFSGAIPPPDN